ncbi:TRAP transporter small permease [Paracoccaceae bacterium GXU_MW_L88]
MAQLKSLIARLSLALGGLVLMLMMLQVVVDVFMRSFLGAGFPATADLVGKYYMVAVSFLPLAVTELERRHIEATIFTDALPERAKMVLFFLGFAIAAAVLSLMLYGSFQEALRKTATGAYIEAGTVRFPTWPSFWILPFSFALGLVVIVIRLIEVVTGTFTDTDHDPLEQVESHEGAA